MFTNHKMIFALLLTLGSCFVSAVDLKEKLGRPGNLKKQLGRDGDLKKQLHQEDLPQSQQRGTLPQKDKTKKPVYSQEIGQELDERFNAQQQSFTEALNVSDERQKQERQALRDEDRDLLKKVLEGQEKVLEGQDTIKNRIMMAGGGIVAVVVGCFIYVLKYPPE